MAITYPKLIITLSDESTLTFVNTDIIDARLVEEMDPISATLPISVLTARVFDSASSFSVFTDDEILSERQVVEAYEIINGMEYYLGRFYLDDWENVDQQTLKLEIVDIIGVMDTTTFDGHFFSDWTSLTDILDFVLAGIDEGYELASELQDTFLRGTIKSGTVREALQQVCFAAGAAVQTSRRDDIGIVKALVPYSSDWQNIDIGVNDKFQDQPVRLKPIVTSIELTCHDNYLGDIEAVVNHEYTADELGIYKLIIDQQFVFDSIGGNRNATLVSVGPNYIEYNVFLEGQVIILAYLVQDETSVLTFTETDLPAITKENKLVVKDASLVNSGIGQAVLDRLRDYYRQRYVHTMTLVPHAGSIYGDAEYGDAAYGWSTVDVRVGQMARIASLQGPYMRAVIEKATINLTGGFLAEMEAVGVKISE